MQYIKTKDRVGLIGTNNKGTKMEIIQAFPNDKIIVKFKDEFGFEKEVHWNNFKRGTVANPYDKTICNIGYVGVGKYKSGTAKEKTIQYRVWENIIYRCYSEKFRSTHLAYADCTVCEEWHNFQVFAKWYENNYYDIGEGRMHIDKDILFKDNKVYSPQTCIFVPQRINMIFMKKDRKIDADLPTGITRTQAKFKASYNGKHIGVFEKLEDAKHYYDIEKQLHIDEVAKEYRGIIQDRLYYALLNWNNSKIAA